MAELSLPDDYVDLLRELDACRVEYLLVDGWAVAVHGHGRATDDMDIFVRTTSENAVRVYEALDRFGAPLEQHGVRVSDFASERYGYRIGRKPILIEILTTIDGVTFDEATAGAVIATVGDIEVPVIGRESLIANKRAAGRPKDLADLEALGD